MNILNPANPISPLNPINPASPLHSGLFKSPMDTLTAVSSSAPATMDGLSMFIIGLVVGIFLMFVIGIFLCNRG